MSKVTSCGDEECINNRNHRCKLSTISLANYHGILTCNSRKARP